MVCTYTPLNVHACIATSLQIFELVAKAGPYMCIQKQNHIFNFILQDYDTYALWLCLELTLVHVLNIVSKPVLYTYAFQVVD